MKDTGTFVPEFPVDDSDTIPDIVLAAAPEPEPRCHHFLPRGFDSDIVLTTTVAPRQSIRVLAPTTDPLPERLWDYAARTSTLLIRATWRECYPSGFCSDLVGWAIVEQGHVVACDARWADKAGPVISIFGASAHPDVAVFADPVIRPAPGLCPICGQPDWSG